MTEELDFSIPSREEKRVKSRSKLSVILMLIILVAVSANTYIALTHKGVTRDNGQGAALSSEQYKDLALKLEKQGLNDESAAAWKDYLKSASLSAEEAARIWYRIGKTYQLDNQYGPALEAFYRSESFAKPEDISPEIARRVQESLEAMGKFAALRYELADRVGTGAATPESPSGDREDPVVAEIGPQKITKSDLDRRIERLIETQISQYASYLPEAEANKRKEDMLKQYSADTQRQAFLSQYLAEEILYRKARESGLMDEPDVRVTLRDLERSVLAGKVMEKEFAHEIKITPGDLETYYEAHKQEYVQPERAGIAHILLESPEEAGEVRKRLEKGEDFASVASERSRDALTRAKGGELAEWIAKGETTDIPGLGRSDTAMAAIFSTDQGHLVKEDVKTDQGIHIIKVLKREKERQKGFDEVKNEVALALRSRKEGEVQQELFTRLKEEYDVVIHQSAFSGVDDAGSGE